MKFRLLLLGIAALLLILACFLPWIGGDYESLNGFRSELGRPAMWIILLAGARVVFGFLKGNWVGWLELLATGAMLFAFVDNFKTAWRINKAHPGSGLWLLLVGIAVMAYLINWPRGKQEEAR